MRPSGPLWPCAGSEVAVPRERPCEGAGEAPLLPCAVLLVVSEAEGALEARDAVRGGVVCSAAEGYGPRDHDVLRDPVSEAIARAGLCSRARQDPLPCPA